MEGSNGSPILDLSFAWFIISPWRNGDEFSREEGYQKDWQVLSNSASPAFNLLAMKLACRLVLMASSTRLSECVGC